MFKKTIRETVKRVQCSGHLTSLLGTMQLYCLFGIIRSGHHLLPVALQVVPRLSYVMLGLNLLVYGTGLSILFTEGFDSEQSYFFSLAKVNEAVAEGEYYRSAYASLCSCICIQTATLPV